MLALRFKHRKKPIREIITAITAKKMAASDRLDSFQTVKRIRRTLLNVDPPTIREALTNKCPIGEAAFHAVPEAWPCCLYLDAFFWLSLVRRLSANTCHLQDVLDTDLFQNA